MKTILIADRNPRILAYLKRELTSEGYSIHIVDSVQHMQRWIQTHPKCDLLIIDPDLSNQQDSPDLVASFRSMTPLPVILHGLPSDRPADWKDIEDVHYIVKSGASVESLKKAIALFLESSDERHPVGQDDLDQKFSETVRPPGKPE